MRIVRVEKYKGERKHFYEVPEMELMKFGGVHIVRDKLQEFDSDVVEWLEEEFMAENDAEDVEDVHDSYETEWFAEGDEI
jgi:hypothetical protein|tara:strand:+ start:8 stop:247 length:240 start_codon:yes stop_codon:yes gene_type:complete